MANDPGFLDIPLNTKQNQLPFVVNPANNAVKRDYNKNSNVQGAGAQHFSFKERIDGEHCYAQIQICPKSIRIAIKKDISYKLLYEPSKQDSKPDYSNGRAKYKDVFEGLPTIHIREYSLNARLNQAIGILSNIAEGFKDGSADASGEGVGLSKKMSAIWKTIKQLFGTDNTTMKMNSKGRYEAKPDDKKKTLAQIIESSFNGYFPSDMKSLVNSSSGRKMASIYSIPWVMYYAMITSFSSNIYDFPFNGTFTFQSDGTNGWTNAGITGASFGSSSFLGQAANYFLKNVKLDFTPTWDGSSEKGTSIEVKVDLFNDTIENTVNNFILINTLIPGNMSLQYNVFQNSPNLYDIKIDGMDRLFMCSGAFSCEYKGVIRKPPFNFFDKLKGHINTSVYKEKPFIDHLIKDDVIRIPDVYSLSLRFDSLMPNNFNNYIFKISNNTMSKMQKLSNSGLIDKSDGYKIVGDIADAIKEQYEYNLNDGDKSAARVDAEKKQANAQVVADKQQKAAIDSEHQNENKISNATNGVVGAGTTYWNVNPAGR